MRRVQIALSADLHGGTDSAGQRRFEHPRADPSDTARTGRSTTRILLATGNRQPARLEISSGVRSSPVCENEPILVVGRWATAWSGMAKRVVRFLPMPGKEVVHRRHPGRGAPSRRPLSAVARSRRSHSRDDSRTAERLRQPPVRPTFLMPRTDRAGRTQHVPSELSRPHGGLVNIASGRRNAVAEPAPRSIDPGVALASVDAEARLAWAASDPFDLASHRHFTADRRVHRNAPTTMHPIRVWGKTDGCTAWRSMFRSAHRY